MHRFAWKDSSALTDGSHDSSADADPARSGARFPGKPVPQTPQAWDWRSDTEAAWAAALSEGARRKVRRLLLRRVGLPASEVDDVVAEAYLRLLASRAYVRNPRRLLDTIAIRCGCDYWRRRSGERPLGERPEGSVEIEQKNLEESLLLDAVFRFVAGRRRLCRRRMIRLVLEILRDASFAGACDSSGIPRGSRERYRRDLRECFGFLVAHPGVPTGGAPRPAA